MTDLNQSNNDRVSLKRSLTLPLVVMFGLAYLAPTVVFNYYGVITESTKGMMALSYLITTIVMFFTAWSYAKMATAYPQAGSAYTYVQKSIGPRAGFLTGWVMLLDYLLMPMACYLLLGVYVNTYFPAIPVWVTVVVIAAIGAVINIVGMKTATIIDTIIIAAQICFCILLIIVIAKFVTGGGGSGTLVDSRALYNPEKFNASAVFTGAAILCVSFLGFDAVTTMAEETKNPKKNIPKAIMIVAVGAGLSFTVIAYFCQIAWPMGFEEIVDPDSGIFELLTRINADFMSNIFFITDNLSSFICALAGLAAVSRILYTMGRDNILPKKLFGKLSIKFQTPIFNILLTSIIALSAIFYADNVFGAVSLVSFGAITGFILVNLSVIVHYVYREKRRSGKELLQYLIMPGIGLAVSVFLWINIDASAKLLGGAWLLLGIVYLAFKTKGFRVLPKEMEEINFDE